MKKVNWLVLIFLAFISQVSVSRADTPYVLGTSTITLMNGSSHVIDAEMTLNGNYNSVTVTPILLHPELGLSVNNQGFKSLEVTVGNVDYLGGKTEPLLNDSFEISNDNSLLLDNTKDNYIMDSPTTDNSNSTFGGLY